MDTTTPYRWCDSTLVRLTPEALRLESLRTGSTMSAPDTSILRLADAFRTPRLPGDVLAAAPEADRAALGDLLDAWIEAEILLPATETAARDDETYWDFHDLHFHVRSRWGRHGGPLGASGARRDAIPTEPPLQPPVAGRPRVELSRPADGAEGEAAAGPGYFDLLRRRRTRYDAAPVSLGDLSRLLWYAARVTGRRTGAAGDLLRKPYPSGGSRHCLEVYPVVSCCPGLEPGVYRYLAGDHALERIVARHEAETPVATLLRDAGVAMGRPGLEPSVLLVLTARFRRVAEKYDGIAYRLILEEVGAFHQTAYLTATALDLAACALGSGNSDLFSGLLGEDYYRETSVGEMVLGGLES